MVHSTLLIIIYIIHLAVQLYYDTKRRLQFMTIILQSLGLPRRPCAESDSNKGFRISRSVLVVVTLSKISPQATMLSKTIYHSIDQTSELGHCLQC